MKQVLKLVKLFLVILLVSFTSCTNDLAPKTTDFNFSFTLPQYDINPRSSTESTSNQISDLQKWIINAQIETSEKVLQNITQEGTSGQTITIHFENIQVSQNVRIDIELTPKGEEKPSYKGTSEWFITKKGSNKIHITLKKIQYEIIPDDDNDTGTDDKPEIIIDAAVPQITTQPENVIEIVTENSGELISMPLSVAAQSTDNGTLSFVWQEKNSDGNWENITDYTTSTTNGQTSCSIDVTVNKGQSRTFKCIITNTNNSVNGNKTATIETNEVTVAYVKGALTSITAKYIGSNYEKYGNEDFYTDGKVTVTEIYKSGDTQTEVEVTADNSRYTISPTNNDEKAIGFVPYTVKYNENTNISKEIRVPVKYELKAEDFSITSSTNPNQSTNSSDNPEKIPQLTGQTVLTVGSKGETSSVPSLIYKTENSDSATDYDIMSTGVTSSWEKDSSACDNTTTSISVDNRNQGNSTYNATLTPISNSWCVGNSITLNYYIQVYPWEIALKTSDVNTVDLTNLTGNTEYTLSATNDADENPSVIFTSDNNAFNITNNTTLKTPTATTTDQTATITAKVDNVTIGTITVTVKKQDPLGSSTNPFTNWNELKDYLYVSSSDSTEIYVKGNLDATETATVNRPVTIKPVGDVNITLDANLSDTLFNVQADFTIRGNASTNFIIYGDNNVINGSLFTTSNSNITLEYVTMQSYTNSSQDSSNPAGGAISFNGTGQTLSLKNCNFTNVITTITPNEEFKTPIGAIYFGNGYLILDNCSFTNASPDYVDLYCYPDDTSKITLKGNITLPIIQYANAFTSSFGDLQITLDSTFNSENIQIYVDNIIDGYDTKLFTLNNGQTLPEYFKLLNEGYVFNYEDGTITEATSGGSGGSSGGTSLSGISVTNETQLLSAIESATDVIIIENNITITEEIDISTPVQIAANSDVTITSNLETEFMFYLYSNLTLGGGSGTLTITGPNHEIALIGTGSATKKITINNGVKFTNCSYYCLSLTGKDTLEINGGEFSSNTMAPIYINNANATVNINSGTISDNSDTSTKGAGIVVNKGTLNITGGTLQNNILNGTDSGASIYVTTDGTATVSGVSLTKNAHYTKTIIDGVEQ